MKYLILFLFFSGPDFIVNNKELSTKDIVFASKQQFELTKEEVSSMLGAAATSSSGRDSTGKASYIRKSRTYTVNIKEKGQSRESNLYYAYERFGSVEMANKLIDSYFESNRNSAGYQQLTGYGDEGFFHTDGENFCTFVARKGSVLIRLKISKLTSKSNQEAVKRLGMKMINLS